MGLFPGFTRDQDMIEQLLIDFCEGSDVFITGSPRESERVAWSLTEILS